MSEPRAATTLLSFRWGPTRCAAPLDGVREVLRLDTLVAVPGARPPLAGLLDLRGEALPVLDLRPLLLPGLADALPVGGPEPAVGGPAATRARDVLVVHRRDGAVVGLLCDEVLGVVDVGGGAPPPAGLPGYVTGMQPGPMPVFDLARLLEELAPLDGGSRSPAQQPGADDPASPAARVPSRASARACAAWTRVGDDGRPERSG